MKKTKTKNKIFGSLATVFKGLLFGSNALGDEKLSVMEEEQMQSPFRTIVKNFFENKLAVTGMVIFLIIFATCFIVPVFKPLDLTYSDVTQKNVSPGFNMLSVPSAVKNNFGGVSAGSTYGASFTKDGKVYLYGKLTDRRMSSIPENMGVVVDISAGHNHLLALNEDGDVFTWGYNRFGLDSVPSEVESLRGEIKSINAGYQISHVLSENGEVVYWGNENLMEIYGLSNYQGNIDDIEFNTSTGMVLTKDNEVYALARSNTPVKAVPEEIQGKVVSIALAEKAAVAILDDGSLVVWGEGRDSRFAPTDEMDGHLFASVEAGRNHFTAITVDGKVFSWGDNNYGQTNVPSALNNQTVVAVETDFHQSYAITADGKLYSWGLSGHLMGTDGDGRDVFTRLVAGGRMTMTVGAIAVIIATIIGVIIGGISGYYGGTLIDNFLMRIAEIVGGLPFLPFAMILSNILGNSITETQRIMLIMVILGLLSWPPLARLARAQILAEREKEFVTAAKAVGIREVSIIFKHILPNVITVLIVSTTLSFASSMLTESTLSFLGFGVIEPNPTWGNMLNKAQDSKVIKDYWWQWIFPALALSLSTISINCVGDGLRDAIDPHSNDR